MDCPACTKPMTEMMVKTRHIYAGDIRRERWRCEPCKITAAVEVIFSVDEPAPAVGVNEA